MALITTPTFDNAQVPGVTSYSYLPDQLIAGPHNLVTQPIVLAAGVMLPRGTVLGQQSSYTLGAAAVAGNTGNGTVGALSPSAGIEYSTGDAVLPSYVLLATDGTHFSVTDPEGNALGNATVGAPYTSAELNFTITAGGTAFVAGDKFTVTATPGTGNYIASVKTATDGSQVPSAILADFTDASLGPVTCGAYVAGEFNGNAVTYDASWSLPLLTTALRSFAIFLKSAVSAADPH